MRQRLISVIVMLVIFVPFLILGGNAFNIFVLLVSLLGLRELLKLRKVPFMIKCLSYVLLILLMSFSYGTSTNYSMILLSILSLLLPLVIYHDDKVYNVLDVFYLFSSIYILSILFGNFIIVRNMGIEYIIYLFLITTITDSFALIFGKKFGKRKLLKSVSPNKTLEGAIAGFIFGLIIPSLFYIFFVNNSNILITILFTGLLSIVGQTGDLIFSSIKRHFGIKDFSNLIPGHGGILDRLDSIFVVMTMYLLIINL